MMADSSLPPLPLFAVFPDLGRRLPWVSLGRWPTPVVSAERFAAAAGLASLMVKREDLSHPECGGNKLRGLEFLLGEARARRADTLLTLGAAGSHHVCRTAYHAARLGITTTALLAPQASAAYVRRNLMAAMACGARLIPVNFVTIGPRLLVELLRPGRRAMFIPPGGTSPLACIGHVNAAFELREQMAAGLLPEPDVIFVAMGSLGTAAGLLLGCKLAGLGSQVVGVAVSYRWYCTPRRCVRVARRTLRLMRRLDPSVPDVVLRDDDVSVVTTSLGPGYAQFTEDAARAAGEFFEKESIALDGTYTGKTLDGLMQYVAANGLASRRLLYWHTYAPALVATEATLAAGLERYDGRADQPLDARFRFPQDWADLRGGTRTSG